MALAAAIDDTDNIFVAGYTTGALKGCNMTGTVDFFFTKYHNDGVQKFYSFNPLLSKDPSVKIA